MKSVLFVLLCFLIYRSSGEWVLQFADEFDGNQLNDSVWVVDDNYEEGYTKDNVRVSDGLLQINMTQQKFNRTAWKRTSGKVFGKFDRWDQGLFKVRCRLPKGRGLKGEVFMAPYKNKYGDFPGSGAITLIHTFVHLPDEYYTRSGLYTGSHYSFSGHSDQLKDVDEHPIDFGNEMHIITLEWHRNKSMAWLVDDYQFHNESLDRLFERSDDDQGTSYFEHPGEPFDGLFYLQFESYFGSDDSDEEAKLKQMDTKDWVNTKLLVDYVRVYQWHEEHGHEGHDVSGVRSPLFSAGAVGAMFIVALSVRLMLNYW